MRCGVPVGRSGGVPPQGDQAQRCSDHPIGVPGFIGPAVLVRRPPWAKPGGRGIQEPASGARDEWRGAGHSSGPRVGFSRAASAGVGTAGDLQVLHGVSHWIPDEAPHTLATMLLDHTGTHT